MPAFLAFLNTTLQFGRGNAIKQLPRALPHLCTLLPTNFGYKAGKVRKVIDLQII